MPRDPDGTYYKYQSTNGSDFTLKGNLSNSYVYQYQHSTGFSEYEPAPEERVVNGGFETGDLTGWSNHIATASSADKYSGIYSAYLYPDAGSGTAYISQSVDFTDVSELTFWYRCEFSGSGTFWVTIDSITIFSQGDADWTKATIDVSSYTGTKTLRFNANVEPEGAEIYIDDISALAE